MSVSLPAWLVAALPRAHAGYAGLAIAQLADEGMLDKDGFSLRSAAFADGEALDPSFTADEEDAVAPPLEWTAPPAGTRELALLVEDADSGGSAPACQWLVWGLAPQRGQLLEGETPPRTGKNAAGNSEWLLPAPPIGADAHDYVFQLFALDTALDLRPGAGRVELLAAMTGHVVGAAVLTASYAREEVDEDAEADWD